MVEISWKEYNLLADFIRKNYGINLGTKKQALVVGRLHNVLLQHNFKNFSEYYDYILSDRTGEAVATLINKITTNHTFFMREADHFYYFKDKVLPGLMETVRGKDIRVWSAGCSTGEEPYTLAMIMDEFFGDGKKLWDTKILATDISSRALEIVKSGIYAGEEIASLPTAWRMNYFRKQDGDRYAVIDRLKNELICRKFNLVEKVFPFTHRFHVIFCRNVMIYFDSETRNELIDKFYQLLEYGGYLFIGHSESLNRDRCGLKYLMPAVFRKE